MVKPDVKRDYYADLDLSPTADPQEITKAFRKLAILYHPDRNRGKEEEFVPKFQTIQTAHEVLSDPVARAKYDEDRRKQGFTKSFARPNNTTNNPYAQSFYRQPPRPPPPPRPPAAQPAPPPPHTRPSYFGPQPSPPQYGYGQSPPFGQTPSPGSSRYTPFGRPAPPPPPQQGSREGYQRRAQEWSAWQTMHNKPPTAKTDANQPKPAQRPTPGVPQNKPGLNRSQTTKTPKKNGFDPSNLDDQWEPSASRTSSYTNFAKIPVSPTPPMPPPPPGPPPRNSGLSPNGGRKRHSIHETGRPVSADSVPYTEGSDRIRTPYSSHTGEKTYFSSAFLGRSTSVRDPHPTASSENESQRKSVPESNSSRARSSSPRRTSNAATPQRPAMEQSRQTRANTAKPRDRGKSSTPKNSIGLDYSSSEDVSSSSPSMDRSSDIEPTVKTPEAGAFGKPVQRNKAQPRRNIRNRPFDLAGSSETSSSNASREFNQKSDRRSDDPNAGSSKTSESLFNAPFYNPNVTPKAREEAETVDTQFSAADWHGKFQGSDFVPPPPVASTSRQTRSQARRATSPAKRGTPSKLWFDSQGEPSDKLEVGNDTAPEAPVPKPQRPPMSTKFSSEEWQKSFKAANWAFPPPPPVSSSTSPTRPAPAPTSRKGSRTPATRKNSRVEGKIPTVQITEEVDETIKTADPTQSNGPPPTATPLSKPKSAPSATSLPKLRDNDAMDVDISPPAPEILKGPRLVKLQAARPEWRDGSTLLTGAIPPVSGTLPTKTTSVPPPPPGPPPAATATRPSTSASAPNPVDSTLNLQDLSNTIPLAPSGTGIQDISDLSATLPFSSQSSSSLTTPTKPLTPQKLELPPIPKGPELPRPGTIITESHWKDLLSKMSVYMGAWYQFETRILDHFQARHVAAARFGVGLPSDAATKLIAQAGEPSMVLAGGGAAGVATGVHGMSSRMGLKAYQRELMEDSRVRKAYSLACERHLGVVEGFIAVKEGIITHRFKPE